MFRFSLFLLLLMLLPAVGQPEAPRKIELNFCCLRYAGDVRALRLKNEPDAPPVEVPFFQGGFTDPVPVLVENGRVVVYKAGADGQAPWIPAWSFAVPADGTAHSVILFPSPPKNDPTAPYTAFLLPPAKDFAYGSVLAVNLTTRATKLELGSKILAIPPGGSGAAGLESEVDAYNMVPVTASIENEGSWFTIHTTRWAYNPRYREVAVVWMDPATKRPEITTIREVRPLPEPSEE